MTGFNLKHSDFANIKYFLSYTQKCMKNAKNCLYEKRNIFKANGDFLFNIWYDNLKTNIRIVSDFQVCVFWSDWEITELLAGGGRYKFLQADWLSQIHGP